MTIKKGALDYPLVLQMWSFVSNKGNKQSKELALDMKTGEIVGVFVGERSRLGADGLWQSLRASRSAMRGLRLQTFGMRMSK